MYDPLTLSAQMAAEVTDGRERTYYRFRATRFYGGIATADVVGCTLRCRFCWSGNTVWHAGNGDLYTPGEVADRLASCAATHGYDKVRLSGGEPTIGRRHLVRLLNSLDTSLLFILETNGILLGADRSYVHELASVPNLHVRVSLKGCTPDEFSLLTGADKNGYRLQLQALHHLQDESLRFTIAVMTPSTNPTELQNQLAAMDLESVMLEKETVKLYPPVEKRLRNTGLLEYFQ